MSATDTVRPSYAEATRGLLRNTVLDAVGELLEHDRWANVTMSAVARRAGVSRQTLYNAIGSRQDLAQAYVIREADRFLGIVREAIGSQDDPHDALAAALEIFLAAAETHPLVRAIAASDDGDELLPLVTTRGGPVLDRVTEELAQAIVESWPDVSLGDARLLCDNLVRLAISHAALPSDPPAVTAAAIARLLSPYVERLV